MRARSLRFVEAGLIAGVSWACSSSPAPSGGSPGPFQGPLPGGQDPSMSGSAGNDDTAGSNGDTVAQPPGSSGNGGNGNANGEGEPNVGPLTPGQGDNPDTAADGDPEPVDMPALERVLIFSRTQGYRHDSIGVGIEAITALGQDNGFSVTASEEPGDFSDEGLAPFDAVIWLSTTADVLGPDQQAAFERYIQSGGGWVGVHAAADTEYDWAWYAELLGGGAYFVSHPAIQNAELEVEEAGHASTAHLPATFQLQDEWYNFRTNPRAAVNVLLRLDEQSYDPGENAMGADHPIAWYHEFDGGRAWYTALGHRAELYQDERFTQHLLGGIRWAAGVASSQAP